MKKIRISPLSAVFLPLAFLICGAKQFALFLAAVIIHESGHVAFILLSSQKIVSVSIMPCGLDIKREGSSSYLTDAAIYIAGPLFNIVFALFSYIFLPSLAFANLAFGVFNLLPVIPLDGGCTLRALMLNYSTLDFAYKVTRIISASFLFITYIGAIIILMYSSWNASLLFLCIMLFFLTFFESGM